MCPPASSLPNVIGAHCTDDEVFMSLKGMFSGSPLPANVCTDVNPHHCLPSSILTGDIWFLTDSEESKDTKHGFWKAKGDASKIFSDPDITGWITTLEFYQGQAKTDWLMHQYTIAFKGPCEDSKTMEVGNLCRLEHAKNPVSDNCIQPSHVSNSDYVTRQGSTSKSHVDKDADTRKLTATEKVLNDPPQNQTEDDSLSVSPCSVARGDYMELLDLNAPLSVSPCSSSENKDAITRKLTVTKRVLSDPPQNLTVDDYVGRGDDYMELLDLDTPLSPSSSSETMSSNECFDSLALLQDLESEINQDLLLEGTGCKYSISASLKPNEVVMSPVTSGPLIISIGGSNTPTEELLKTKPGTCADRGGGFKGKAASSSSFDRTLSGNNTTLEKAAPGRKKTLKKYFCFMPF